MKIIIKWSNGTQIQQFCSGLRLEAKGWESGTFSEWQS